MEAGWRGRGVPVLNEMIMIKLNELLKQRGVGTSFFSPSCAEFTLYLGDIRQRERMGCLKGVEAIL